MPRLIAGGPDIPAELIEKQEAGEMVFFCGAGISVPTGLPGFRGLVEQLYSSLNVSRTSGEEEAIERGEFDKALDSLEHRLTANAMREEVARLLSAPPKPASLRLHHALLAISRSASGRRLVTTNYDDNFARADDTNDLRFHVGPNVPKDFDNWNSVVHLHGRIEASISGPIASPLVLTDTDFGEAYLSKRWAADFVLNLMDRHTVVFVGYSMADVVVRYLTKAVSSTPGKHRIYSLVGYADQSQRATRESQWQGHRIQPILYDSRNDHEMLLLTVEEWTMLAADPHGYRVQVAVSGLSRTPDPTTHEADPDRVVWALTDPAAAWPAFNQIRRNPVPGPQAAAWLHEFAVRGLLGGTVSSEPHERGPAGPLITARAEQQMLQADSVSQAVTLWVEIHAHVPEVFKWVIDRGHNIHFELRRRLWDRLTATEEGLPDISPRLVRLWTLLLAEPPEDYEFLIRLDRILKSVSQPIPEAADDILLRLLRPHLGVLPGPAPYRYRGASRSAPSTPEEVALHECGHTDVILGCRNQSHRFNVLAELQPSRFEGFLRRHAITLTEDLKSAFSLLKSSDRGDARFNHLVLRNTLDSDDFGEMTISGTDGVETRRRRQQKSMQYTVGTWTVLMDWVSESYRALPEGAPQRDELLRAWVNSDEKTLWRLALDAIARDRNARFECVRPLLLQGAQLVLWDHTCEREVLATLKEAGSRGSVELQRELVEAVQSRAGQRTDQPDSDGAILAEVGWRLEALEDGGVPLPREATKVLAKFKQRRDSAGRRESQAIPAALGGRIRQVIKALQERSVDPGEFDKFTRERPAAALLALGVLGQSGEWPVELWKKALGVVQTKIKNTELHSRHGSRLVELLLGIPDDLFSGLQHEISGLVDVLSERWSSDDDIAFWHLWRLGWVHRSHDSGILSRTDALTHAMNTTAGTYADAALKRIREVTKQTSGTIADDHLRMLDRIACDESGPSGLMMLSFQMKWLYEHAPEWTTQRILPRMRWENGSTAGGRGEEIRALWEVTAVRGSLTPDLVRVLGSDLWTAVRHHKEFAHGENLIRFFIYVSTSEKSGLIDKDTCREIARIAIRDEPLQVGVALSEVLKRSPDPAEDNWRVFVRPWLESYWPRERTLNTAESSSALVNVIMGTGNAFPDAVEWANGYVTALNDQQIGSVWYHKKVWKSHPRAAVTLLHRIVPAQGIDPWARSSLAEMLKGLKEIDSTVAGDSRFVELENRAAK